MHFTDSDALCRHVSEQTAGRVILSFSGGKDSIGAWLQLRRYFNEIVPVYLYLVPRLSFVEEDLAYYEQVFGQHIMRMPHPSLYRWLNNLVFQAPEHIRPIMEARLWEFDYESVAELIRLNRGLPLETLAASGVRAVDSPYRWAAIKQHGPINEGKRKFYPVYDWRKERLLTEIREAGIKLGVQYKLFGRTFDGLDFRFLKPIRDNYPEDYDRILEFFPLAELSLRRMQYRARHHYGMA